MTFSLALTGDSMITRGALISSDDRALALGELIRGADVAFTNLEVVATDVRGYHSTGPFTPSLVAPAAVLDELVGLFDVVSFANNHTLNLGIDGLLDTMRGLRTRGIACAGVGETLSEASVPAYVDRPTGSVGVVACATTFTSGDEATRPSDTMIGRPGLNPVRHLSRLGVTAAQLESLVQVHRQLGLQEQLDYLRDMRFLPPIDPADTLLFGERFFVADQPCRRTTCTPQDLDRMRKWVAEAKARSRVALVSVHSHESGASLVEPAEFLVDFAHQMIDAGADAVVGHGPHRVRGIEMYRGRPIFYSLGNFVAESELAMLSSHSYDVFGASDDLTPHEVVGGARVGFADHEDYWRSVVPMLHFGADRLERIALHPISRGHERPEHERGRPSISDGPVAAAVLDDLEALSAPFGTVIRADEFGAFVELAE
jgi:poly-gamma-glutamate synthesis protein (capsule biosynthesis protein)